MMGAYSGIDMSVIDQLIEAEKAKGVKFTNQKTKIETEQNAWKDVNSRLDTLHKKLEALTKKETFNTRTVSSNIKESASLTVSAGEKAAIGQYRVHVSQLAESSRLTGTTISGIESIDEDLGFTGDFSFKVESSGSETIDVSIEINSEDSLRDITDKINSTTKDSGVRASIVDNRLVLTDTNMGESTITTTTNLSDSEGNLVADGLGFENAIHTPGQAAEFTIDGILIERNSNSIDDVVEGLTFNLSNVHREGESEIITIAADDEKTTAAVKEFVDQYNSVMDFLSKQLDVGDPSAENNKTGVLTGDGTVIRLQSGLRSLMTRSLEGDFSGTFKNIEDIGITIDRYGVASFDEAVFNEALQEDPTNVAKFFYSPDMTPEEKNDAGEVVTQSQEQDGMSELLQNFIDTYISTSTTAPGIISNKNKSFDNMLKDINEQIEVFNNRVERKRDRLVQQFTALDIAMMQAQSQMDYMYSQLGMGQTNQQ